MTHSLRYTRLSLLFDEMSLAADSDERNSEAKRRLYDTGITVTRASGTKMLYEENSFDCVTCVEGEPHMNSREDFFREAFQVLKPGGKLFMADIVTLKALPDLSYLQQIILKTAVNLWDCDSSL